MKDDDDRVMRLGRELADALDPSDVAGRWMSHHLAELLGRWESAPDPDLERALKETILRIWEHKRGASLRIRPFAHMDTVLDAVARLQPDPEPWAFYRPFVSDEPSPEALLSYPLLQSVCEFDRLAGRVIRMGIAVASREAISREEPWVISGIAVAETEEDRAVRALEALVRRYQLEAFAESGAGNVGDEGSDNASDEAGGLQWLSEIRTEEDDSFAPQLALQVSLRSASEQCRQLLRQIESALDALDGLDAGAGREGDGGSASGGPVERAAGD